MFKVNYNWTSDVESEISVDFNHYTTIDGNRATGCTIHCDGLIMGLGSAVCVRPDIFNKNTGRKIALTKALKDGRKTNPNVFTREFRSEIWNMYFSKRQRVD